MGYMTTITLLNDGFDGIEKNPEKFIASINDAMAGCRDGRKDGCGITHYSIGTASNMQTFSSYHADETKILICGQNYMSDLTKVFGFKSAKDIEFQLSRIGTAQCLLDYTKKALERQLAEIQDKEQR